jgi:hypothetical protein
VSDENLLKKQIYDLLKPYVSTGIPKKVSNLLEVLYRRSAFAGRQHSCGERNPFLNVEMIARVMKTVKKNAGGHTDSSDP